ncbi:cathepsin L-like [Rhynchophorus ferrugineus]|uniref:cathepsin L-like n=1 Tax=Rhynchophorus ferrugineus TaxID=354439 RepID=UPI003FCE9C29
MIRFLLVSLLVVAATSSALDHASEFYAFKLKHGKTYKNQVEETKRFNIFKSNIEKIASHNARYEQGLATYTLGINQFADMTAEEFSTMLGYQSANKPKLNITGTFKKPEGVEIPDSIDWREQNRVTAIKNQGSCGSCWAFSITGSTEGAYARKTGNLVSLSEQQLIDCTTDFNSGCAGGYLEKNFVYVTSDGLQSESSYPYEGVDNSCKYDASQVVTRVSSYVTIFYDEQELRNAVGTVGPVSVGINAGFLQLYSGGIFHEELCNPMHLNHAVLVVGYGSENGEEYWIVKNSWGTSWGEEGYFRFKFGVDECGINTDNVYPIID